MTPELKSLPEKSHLTLILADRLRQAQPGETVTHEELSRLIDRDTRHDAAHLLRSALHTVLCEDRAVFACVRTIGYKRLQNRDILKTGDATIKKTRRACRRGIAKILCAQYDDLDNADKIQHNTTLALLGAVAHLTEESSRRKLETRVAANNDWSALAAQMTQKAITD